MEKFKLVNICDEKAFGKYNSNCYWKKSVLLPCYREGYICFSCNENYSFEELIKIFLHGNDDDQIGAISIISEKYPCELYKFICNQRDYFPPKKLKFLFELVVPSYLPLVLPQERLMNYEFNQELLNDIWVNILVEIRALLQKQIQ